MTACTAATKMFERFKHTCTAATALLPFVKPHMRPAAGIRAQTPGTAHAATPAAIIKAEREAGTCVLVPNTAQQNRALV